MRALVVVLLLAPVVAGEDWRRLRGRPRENAIYARWRKAGAGERRSMVRALESIHRGNRFIDAAPVQVRLKDRAYTLAELFLQVLEPALQVPPFEGEELQSRGLAEEHRTAVAGLRALGAVYAPPAQVRTGTLDLLLDYGRRILEAPALGPKVRLQMFAEVVRVVRVLDGRATPGLRTRFLIRDQLLPTLRAVSRNTASDGPLSDLVSQTASMLYLPSILDEGALLRLAPLVRGRHGRELLLRAYRAGGLDMAGVLALAGGIASRMHDDAAFAAGAPPLLLELLCDARMPAANRYELARAAFDSLGEIGPLQESVLDLMACAWGHRGNELASYAGAFEAREDKELPRPTDSRLVRFLRVVLVRGRPGDPPRIAEVVRSDVPSYQPLHTSLGLKRESGRSSGRRRFVGVLVPSRKGPGADFLGPPPGLTSGGDRRLLRRALEFERLTIHTFGVKSGEIELCVALPEDASEPVPVEGASLTHVLGLVARRLERTSLDEERQDLLRLLAGFGTDDAKALALRYATGAASSELLTLAERGDRDAQGALLGQAASLSYRDRFRLFTAVAKDPGPHRDRLLEICRTEPALVASVAAERMLGEGADAAGAMALLKRPDPHTRLCGVALALRMGPLAGGLRIRPTGSRDADARALAGQAVAAFAEERGIWKRFSAWTHAAFFDHEKIRDWRDIRNRKLLVRVGRNDVRVSGEEFAGFYISKLKEGKVSDKTMNGLIGFLLRPQDPGKGIPEAILHDLFDQLEKRAKERPMLRAALRDNLAVLVCAFSAMEQPPPWLAFADQRLRSLSGLEVPVEARSRLGVYWGAWAAYDAAQEDKR
ncbi:MAG: hypothetical protein V3T86_03445 [Planctomycetota bacterium]